MSAKGMIKATKYFIDKWQSEGMDLRPQYSGKYYAMLLRGPEGLYCIATIYAQPNLWTDPEAVETKHRTKRKKARK